MSKTIAHRTEQSFKIGDRSVVLALSSSWVIIPLFEHGYAEIVKKLDAFGALSN
jgi:hypothetical protein